MKNKPEKREKLVKNWKITSPFITFNRVANKYAKKKNIKWTK